jgi:uncharacterized membrane protein
MPDGPSAPVRVLVSVGAGAVTAGVVVVLGAATDAPMLGWDVGALLYVVSVWFEVHRLDAAETKRLALKEDPGRRGAELLVLASSVASIAAVVLVMARVGTASGAGEWALLGACLASIVLSWVVVHTAYTLRYAHLYYGEVEGGIDFNQEAPPCYVDFAYLAFTLGMTFQVSDTSITNSGIRATALAQSLLSYVFGAVILATTINLIAGLGSRG